MIAGSWIGRNVSARDKDAIFEYLLANNDIISLHNTLPWTRQRSMNTRRTSTRPMNTRLRLHNGVHDTDLFASRSRLSFFTTILLDMPAAFYAKGFGKQWARDDRNLGGEWRARSSDAPACRKTGSSWRPGTRIAHSSFTATNGESAGTIQANASEPRCRAPTPPADPAPLADQEPRLQSVKKQICVAVPDVS